MFNVLIFIIGAAIGTMSGMAAFELRKDGLSVMPVFAP